MTTAETFTLRTFGISAVVALVIKLIVAKSQAFNDGASSSDPPTSTATMPFSLNDLTGKSVGDAVGRGVGGMVGSKVGAGVGGRVGRIVGCEVGLVVGGLAGWIVGVVGKPVGSGVGWLVGIRVGNSVGVFVGTTCSTRDVGCADGDGVVGPMMISTAVTPVKDAELLVASSSS